MFAVWPRAAWEGQGTLETYNGRGFCPNCGSRVANLSVEEAELMVGTLDDGPSDLFPQYELWIDRREAWLHSLPWADQFKRDRHSEGDWRQPVVDT